MCRKLAAEWALVMEATMGESMRVHGFTWHPARGISGPSRHGFSHLVSDGGDDHEMAEDFGNSLARAGDRAIGFVAGAGILAAAWAIWMLI
jgi:hypothetical protein